MSNPLLYSEEHFVVLATDQPEQIITATELFEKLKGIVADRQDNLPRDVQRLTDLTEQTTYLMSTACELDLGPDQFLQWYAVRLEK